MAMAPRPVSWHPVPERIASVIAGTGGAEVPLQLGEPPPNAGFPGERLPRQPVETGCLTGRRPPWTSAQTSIRTGSTSPVNRDSERKTNHGSNYGTKE
jgi:hypothetical protein